MSANPSDLNFGEYMSGQRRLTAAVAAEEAKAIDAAMRDR